MFGLQKPLGDRMSDIVPQNRKYRPRGRPWPKGQSGNPAGRRKGCRNWATRMAAIYLDGEAEGLLRRTVELAHAGSGFHMKLALDRTLPPLRERPMPFTMPPITSAADLAPAMDAILAAVSRGRITTSQAVELSMVVATRLRALEADEFNRRLLKVEHGDPSL
jgi:hypothetical protein